MLTAVDEYGDPLFFCLRYFSYCDDCKEKGIQATCKHKEGEIAWWWSTETKDKLREFMGQNSSTYASEIMGEISDENVINVFNLEAVIALNKSKPYFSLESSEDPAVHVCVDPCGTGKSEYAITSCYFDKMILVVS